MSYPIFSHTSWVSVSIPKGYDPTWTDADKWYYASMWVAATSKGFSETRAEQLAEALVSRRLYPGLRFSKELEEDLRRFVCEPSD